MHCPREGISTAPPWLHTGLPRRREGGGRGRVRRTAFRRSPRSPRHSRHSGAVMDRARVETGSNRCVMRTARPAREEAGDHGHCHGVRRGWGEGPRFGGDGGGPAHRPQPDAADRRAVRGGFDGPSGPCGRARPGGLPGPRRPRRRVPGGGRRDRLPARSGDRRAAPAAGPAGPVLRGGGSRRLPSSSVPRSSGSTCPRRTGSRRRRPPSRGRPRTGRRDGRGGRHGERGGADGAGNARRPPAGRGVPRAAAGGPCTPVRARTRLPGGPAPPGRRRRPGRRAGCAAGRSTAGCG